MTHDLTMAACPTCGRLIPGPIEIDAQGRVECPAADGHRVSAEQVVVR